MFPVVVNFGLRREIKQIILFGLPELQLMIEEILLNSTTSGRLTAIMRITEMLILCFCAVRPSSLGPCNPEMLEHRKVSLLLIVLPPKTYLSGVPPLEARFLRQGETGSILL